MPFNEIQGSPSSDTLVGTEGDDAIDDFYGGNDTLLGNGGNDSLSVFRTDAMPASVLFMDGGSGDDSIYFTGFITGSGATRFLDTATFNGGDGNDFIVSSGLLHGTIDAGAGNDSVAVDRRIGTYSITLGSGVDRFSFEGGQADPAFAPHITITDFQPGNLGDKINLDSWLSYLPTNIAGTNPFSSGYMTLVQSGSDTLLKIGSTTLITLKNTDVHAFTGVNFGYSPTGSGTTITGTSGPDMLSGTDQPDELYGLDGNDNLDGGGGDDLLVGGVGDDILHGDGAHLVWPYFTGNDILRGGAGNDLLAGGQGSDLLDGGDGDDVLTNAGFAQLTPAGPISELPFSAFFLLSSDDVFDGGAGFDIAYMLYGQDSHTSGIQVDISNPTTVAAISSAGIQVGSITGIEVLRFFGTGHDDNVHGGAYADLLRGAAGNDWLDGGGGADELIGNQGDDVYIVDNSGDIVTELAGEGTDTILTALNTYALPGNVERLEFTRTDAATLTGNADANTILGGAGNDTINGATGADAMAGNLGNDLYMVDDSGDVVTELANQGTDTVLVSTATGLYSYSLSSTAEIELFKAADPSSTVYLDLTGNDFSQRMEGNNGPNHLFGGRGDDVLYGFDGEDNLAGVEGADTMVGGRGNDYYNVDNVGDVVTELPNEGIDQVTSYLAQYTLPDNVEVLRFGSTCTLAVGNASDNDILANGTLRGLGGNDTLLALGGNDILEGGNGNDVLTGGLGTDLLTGGAGSDVFRDTAAGLNGDTIADLALGERITITDVNLATFHYQLSGSVLTYSGGTLIFQNAPVGHFIATAAAGGGVDLTLKSTVHNDFNGDGRSDILWRSASGALSDWLGNANGGFAGNDGNAYATVPTSWKMAGTGDFNGDGRTDILWRNNDGSLSDWLATPNGGFAANDANAFTKVATSWHVVSTGDFNGDGREDLLWRSDSGALSDWLANANGGFASNDANAYTTAPTSWKVAGTGDFNGDGREDILWRSDSGALSDWLANANGGFTSNDANAYATVPTSWHIAGTGDYNGDGREDILWRNDSGALSNWLANANGGFAANDANAHAQASTDWHIQAHDYLIV